MPRGSLTTEQRARQRAGITRYARLARAYKAAESQRLGIPPNKVKITGNSEQASRFKRAYSIIKNPKKPAFWNKQLSRLGLGADYWAAYRESKEAGLADVQTREF